MIIFISLASVDVLAKKTETSNYKKSSLFSLTGKLALIIKIIARKWERVKENII